MYRFLLLTFVVAFSFLSCQKRDLPTPPVSDETVTIEASILPRVVNPGKSYVVAAKITGADPELVEAVVLTVSRASDNEIILQTELYDDGGALHPNDGDVVARDGVFSNRIEWNPPQNSREKYLFQFVPRVPENISAESLVETVTSLANVPPEILLLAVPDSLESGFELAQFKAEVSDSNGLEDINTVKYSGLKNGAEVFRGQLSLASEPASNPDALLFSASFDSSFAIAKKGVYQLVFEAVDGSGAKSNPVTRDILIKNNPPVLHSVTGPSEFERPNNGTSKFLLTVAVRDEQSLGDVKIVKLIWQKADGTFSANSPFTMYDNGLPFNDDFTGWNDGYRGDVTANDGVYSITALFDQNQPLGNYTLTMVAEDFAGNLGDNLVHIIKLKDDE